MGADSKIEWTHATFNIAWGCTRVSPACEHCYAEAWAKRHGVGWGPNAERLTFGEKHWAEPLKWDRAAAKAGERRRVFCSSMADVFEDHPTIATEREKLWHLIRATPNLDWLLLTKRIERWRRCWPLESIPGHVRQNEGDGKRWVEFPNVWLGTTVESQRYADERIPHLLQAPAAVRFLSVEPLLGPVNLRTGIYSHGNADRGTTLDGIHWVIVGGESGPGARPMHPDWARSIRDQCQAAGVAFHFKQHGEWFPSDQYDYDTGAPHLTGRPEVYVGPQGQIVKTTSRFDHGCPCDVPRGYVSMVRVGKKAAGRLLDGREWNEFPATLEPAAS